MRIRKWILTLLLAFPLCAGYAQERRQADTLRVKVYFRQGYSKLEPDFRDNGVRLDSLVQRLAVLRADTLWRGTSIRITGATSPEGVSTLNERLARKRAENVRAWLEAHPACAGAAFDIRSKGIDWESLTHQVETSRMPYRDEVLDILRNTPVWVIREGKVVDSRFRQLGMLHGGRAWQYMYRNFFPELRNAGITVEYEVVRDTVPVPLSLPEPAPRVEAQAKVAPVPVPAPATPPMPERKPFYMAVKTNMLYDAALVPNIGVECWLGKGWSAGASWMYAWWDNDGKHRYWRVYGGEVEVRKYIGKAAAGNPLAGHHIGVYAQMLTYDFEWGGTGYLGDRWSYGAGFEYGYSLPVAKRLNIDFGIGFGYLGGEYKKYVPQDGHYVWQETKQRHWFGPTKAEISLVWRIGRGNCNKAKGGAR